MDSIILIFSLFILESLLSVDNAAVLAIMVRDLPPSQQPKALKYGIGGAFIFRGLCLLTASILVKILWLKIAGGLYLLRLVYGHFTKQQDIIEEGIDKHRNKWYGFLVRKIGTFWSTVVLVEFMDIAFSIDNIFAAVAMTNNIYLIMIGVAIGIVSMRFVAQWFTLLMIKFPSLEASAFIVIMLLGIKLIISGIVDYSTAPVSDAIKNILTNRYFDLSFSASMMMIFFIPLLFKKNYVKIEN